MQIIIDSEMKALERKGNSHDILRHCISRSLNELKGKHDKNLELATFIYEDFYLLWYDSA